MARGTWKHRANVALVAVAALGVTAGGAHLGVRATTAIEPPPIEDTTGEPLSTGGDATTRTLGPAWYTRHGKLHVVYLSGTPAQIGHQHARLLYDEMRANETRLFDLFDRFVPLAPARWLLTDIALVRFRHVDDGMGEARRTEIAAQARAFSPDPYASFLPTYHRFVFLHALYDIALSFERSPLVGCTSFVVSGPASASGLPMLARNFDFEIDPIFDEQKAVFVVSEQGRIPYASVSWPGFVGTVTGMNAEGLALAVHGARAREPVADGEPVAHTMRDVLGRARTVDEAVAILADKRPMVSHLVILAGAEGASAIVERAPGEPIFVRRGDARLALTNHFEGPLADDPKNRAVESSTSTLPRRQRLDELLANLRPRATVQDLVGVLRDKKALGGADLPAGDRRAIDALIATHGVVLDTSARALWVSEGPHLLGRFLKIDLRGLLERGKDALVIDAASTIDQDPFASSPELEAFQQHGRR